MMSVVAEASAVDIGATSDVAIQPVSPLLPCWD
jgi:hypothetical protein